MREPGGTPAAERIRDLVKDETELSPIAETLLFGAARADLVEQRDPARRSSEGRTVICDRYVDSTVAYQGGARGLGIERVEELNRWITGDLWPDVTFLLDVDAGRGRRARAESVDRFEREGEELQRAVAAAYDELAERHADRYVRIDASRAPGGGARGRARAGAGDEPCSRRPSTSRARASRSRRRCATTSALSHAYLFHGPPGQRQARGGARVRGGADRARRRRPGRRASGACCRACIPTSPGSSRAARTRSWSTTCARRSCARRRCARSRRGVRVFVIVDADRMNDESQNALLKTLEEPAVVRALRADQLRARAAAGDDPVALPARALRRDPAGADRRAARGGGRRAATPRSPARACPAAMSSARARWPARARRCAPRPRPRRGRCSPSTTTPHGCSPQPWGRCSSAPASAARRRRRRSRRSCEARLENEPKRGSVGTRARVRAAGAPRAPPRAHRVARREPRAGRAPGSVTWSPSRAAARTRC